MSSVNRLLLMFEVPWREARFSKDTSKGKGTRKIQAPILSFEPSGRECWLTAPGRWPQEKNANE